MSIPPPPQDQPQWPAPPPGPASYSTYPTPPPGYQPPPHKDRTGDLVGSWILYVVQIIGSVVMWIISIFAYFVDSLCDGGSDACVEDSSGTILTGYWIALLVLAVGTLVAMIVATATRRLTWPWALGGFLLTVITTIVFFVLLAN